MCNSQCILLVGSNYKIVLVYELIRILILRLFFIDVGVVDSDSEKYLWSFFVFFSI